MNITTISIALTTYNGEKYLQEQLESIYNQTFNNFEVIVCDDCSSDRTVSILEEYRKKYGLRYYVNDQNIGFVKNFEKAISLCKGEYIALSDQDDIWKSTKLETLLSNIGDAFLITSDAELIDESGVLFHESFRRYSKLYVVLNKQFESLLFHNFVQGATLMFRNELLKIALPFPDGIGYHDWWLALCASYHNKIIYYDKPLIRYRILCYSPLSRQ